MTRDCNPGTIFQFRDFKIGKLSEIPGLQSLIMTHESLHVHFTVMCLGQGQYQNLTAPHMVYYSTNTQAKDRSKGLPREHIP